MGSSNNSLGHKNEPMKVGGNQKGSAEEEKRQEQVVGVKGVNMIKIITCIKIT